MPNNWAIVDTAYLRTGSTALGAYEYLRIFPTAIDFYMVQWRRRKISIALVLFVLIRVTSIALLIISQYAVFYPNFTPESCSKYYLAAPTLRTFQIMISQCIMGVRTYNLSGRLKLVGVFILTLYTSVCVLQWVSILHDRHVSFIHLNIPVVGVKGSCLLAGVEYGFGTWVFYAAAITYDTTVTLICAYYLLKYKRIVKATFLSNLMDAMIYDGLFYFVALTLANAVNMLLLQSSSMVSVQKAAVSVLFVLVWILSQYIVLGQYRAQQSRTSSAHIILVPASLSSAEAGPSGMSRVTSGDASDRQGAGMLTEWIEIGSTSGGDHSDRLGSVTQATKGYSNVETALFAKTTQSPRESEGIELQAREDV